MHGLSKKTIFTVLLGLTVNTQASSDLPDLQMHVFEEDSGPVNDSPGMKMVIYSNDTPPIEQKHATGGDLRLAYNKNDDTVSVYKEDSQAANVVPENERSIDIEFYADVGYREDSLVWNKAASSGTPNILSELTWDNIEIAVVEVGTSIHTPSHWVFDARFAYGTIFSGDNQDSDYFGNNRTLEFSRSNNNADEGSTIDASIGLGYRATIIPGPRRFKKPILSFTPKVGYSYHAQNLTLTDGTQTIPYHYTFAGLDSKYDTSWYGPWVGFDSELSFADRVSFTTAFEYHYADYEATAEWNLRSDREQPKSFSHTAEGFGILASVGSQYKISRDLSLNVSIDYQEWRADKHGRTTEYFIDGSRSSQKLNEVNWDSIGGNIGLRYSF